MELSNSQKEAEIRLLKFIFDINRNNNFFLLTGSAGTGKSTLISYILNDDRFKKKKIVFSATTNKAVSILEKMGSSKIKNREIIYLTIQKLLNIKRKIDKDGNELFEPSQNVKKAKSIFNYDIIVIDESSMISKDIISEINKIKSRIKGKIIFLGDKAQLPPVNEIESSIFNQTINNFELQEIMRYNGNLVLLANKFRDLVFNRDIKIKFKDFKNENIKIYKDYNKWLVNYTNKLHKLIKKENFNFEKIPIFLVYTNLMCDKINNGIRNILFPNVSDKFIVGEIIIFNNYYYNTECKTKYYTSQKMQIKNIKNEKYTWYNYISKLLEQLELIFNKFILGCSALISDEEIENIKNFIFAKIKNIFHNIPNIDVSYYNMTLQNEKKILVLSDVSKNEFSLKMEEIKDKLKNFKKSISKKYKNNSELKILIDAIMLNVWEYFYIQVLDIFADIGYGYCITTHKSQGSTFNNVYVHLNNIIKRNNNEEESYRCLYTAITRTSKKINILISD